MTEIGSNRQSIGEEPRKGMRERRMDKEEERETMNAVLMTKDEYAEKERETK